MFDIDKIFIPHGDIIFEMNKCIDVGVQTVLGFAAMVLAISYNLKNNCSKCPCNYIEAKSLTLSSISDVTNDNGMGCSVSPKSTDIS